LLQRITITVGWSWLTLLAIHLLTVRSVRAGRASRASIASIGPPTAS